jgi:hypothetical protein
MKVARTVSRIQEIETFSYSEPLAMDTMSKGKCLRPDR